MRTSKTGRDASFTAKIDGGGAPRHEVVADITSAGFEPRSASPGPPTFSPDAVMRQGSRRIGRHRIIAGGSLAVAVGLIAFGTTLATHPGDVATPPAGRTTTGIVRAQVSMNELNNPGVTTYEVQINRDPRVVSNVQYVVITKDGKRHRVGASSTGKPGMPGEARVTWGSAMVDGHPVTIGIAPATAQDLTITFANGTVPSGIASGEKLAGTGYQMFAVNYPALSPVGLIPKSTAPGLPPEITSIRWSGSTGMVDGWASSGDHRLTGRVFTLNETLTETSTVDVVLRPRDDGRTTVFGLTRVTDHKGSYSMDLSAATTDASGAAIVTGHQPILERTLSQGQYVMEAVAGPPVAAGVLPSGATDIGVDLASGEAIPGRALTQRLPDGRVIFALNVTYGTADPRKASIKAVTWHNADGAQGRIAVTQKKT